MFHPLASLLNPSLHRLIHLHSLVFAPYSELLVLSRLLLLALCDRPTVSISTSVYLCVVTCTSLSPASLWSPTLVTLHLFFFASSSPNDASEFVFLSVLFPSRSPDSLTLPPPLTCDHVLHLCYIPSTPHITPASAFAHPITTVLSCIHNHLLSPWPLLIIAMSTSRYEDPPLPSLFYDFFACLFRTS